MQDDSRRTARDALLLACSIVLACDAPAGRDGVTQPVTTPTTALAPLASDGFNRADENPIAGNWTSGPGVAADVQLLNNAVKAVTNADPNGVAYWNAVTWPANQWSEVTIRALSATGDGGPAVRIAAAAGTYYLAPVYADGHVAIYRSIDHSFSQLYTSGAGTVVAGDRVRLEAEGTVLRVFRNDVLLGQVADNAIASGSAGILQDDTSGAVDDWAGGSLDSSPPPPPSPPAEPTTLAATAASASQIALSWTDNATDETGFRIERCTGASCSGFVEIATVGANVASYQNTGLTASTSYSYRVRAYHGAGTSPYSNTASATTAATPPGTGPLATDAFNRPNENPIAGQWTSGPSGFEDIQIVSNAVRGVTAGRNNVAFYHAVAWPNDQWSEVRIANLTSGPDGGPSVRISATTESAYLFAVVGPGTSYLFGKRVNGVFTQLASAAHAFAVGDVLRLEARGDTLRAFQNGTLVTTVLDASLPAGNAGIWIWDNNAGFSFDDWAGGAVGASPPPPPPSPPAAPTNLAAAAVSASQINLTWTDNATNETGFQIERCTGASCSGFAEIATGGANVVSYQNTGLAASTTYRYRVRAYNAGSTSSYSNTVTATTSAPPAADRLPDLGMARLSDLRIDASGGRRRLRYSTTIVNVGAGKYEVRGRRANTAEPTMSVVQRVFNDAGGWREVSTAAVMIFGGDGHNHWHVRDLQQSELFRLDDDTYLAQSDKRGFCFWDNVRYQLSLPGAPQSPVYQESGCGGTGSLTTAMGLSIGWGDIYPYSLPDQFIDVTTVPDGRYRLVVTADPFGWFTETSDGNNFTWVSLELWDGGRQVRVLQYGPNATVAAFHMAQWKRTWPAPRRRPVE